MCRNFVFTSPKLRDFASLHKGFAKTLTPREESLMKQSNREIHRSGDFDDLKWASRGVNTDDPITGI
jgi:hypothetical protein